MKTWLRGAAFFATTGALAMLAAAGGCGSNHKRGGTTPPATVPSDLNLEIQSADVPATGNATVTFRATDAAGQPIDLLQELKNGVTTPAPTRPSTSAPRFTISQLQDDGTYVDYYEATATGKPYIPEVGGTAVPPALPTATQATSVSVPTADPALGQQLVAKGDGVYAFTLVPSQTTTVRTGLDRSKTHTVGMWATRTLAAAGDPGHPAHSTFNFVPAGGTAGKREVVSDQACNTCHGVLEAHDRRTGTQLCLTCHSPQSTDPESGNTVDFRVMIHKIHRGLNLPSVKSGTPYRIVGFGGNPPPATLPATAVQDFSDVSFPQDVRNCAVCHQGAQGDNWKNAPSRAACLACHDNVVFDGSAGATVCAPGVTAPCNHKGGQIHPTTACSACHTGNEVEAVHVNQVAAAGAKFKYEIVGVTMGADRKPVVQLRVTDPTNNDTPYVLNASGGGTASEPFSFTANGASRLFVDIGWPSEDYANTGGSATAPGQPVQVNVLGSATVAGATPVAGQPGVWQVTSPTAVPADTSFTVALEGHPAMTVGATQARIPVTNDVKYFSAAGAPNGPARRQVVSEQKCNACHGMISFHGNNRTNTTQICVVCHNPDATDKGQRKVGTPQEIPGDTPIDLKWMIHAIHATGMKQPFTIYGFGGSPNQFPAEFPGRVDNCNNCHVNDSWKLPIADAAHDTTYDSGASIADPSDNLRWNKYRSVCSSCHDNDQARTHIDSILAENPPRECATCHGAGGVKDISTVHRIVPNAQ